MARCDLARVIFKIRFPEGGVALFGACSFRQRRDINGRLSKPTLPTEFTVLRYMNLHSDTY